MVKFQKLDFLQFLTINSVTTGTLELNGTSQISLATHNSKHEMGRDLDEIWSGLSRMFLECSDRELTSKDIYSLHAG